MDKRPFFWHLFPSFFIVAVIACAIIIVYTIYSARSFHFSSTQEVLSTRAHLFLPHVQPFLSDTTGAADSVCAKLGKSTNTRYTVILAGGRVLGDSHEDPDSMDNHADRPEIIEALESGFGVATRYSATLNRTLMYVALPITIDNQHKAVVRASVPLISVRQAFNTTSTRILWAGVVVAVLSIALSLAISRKLSRPIEELRQNAERFAKGNFSVTLPVSGSRETAELSAAMSSMAKQLGERIGTITRQNNEREAILSSMIEGVIAVDKNESVIMINDATSKMLGVSQEMVKGKWVQECIRNAEIQRFVSETVKREGPIEREIQTLVADDAEKTFRLHGTQLSGAHGEITGALVVMDDITDFKRLENVRRDFVANVSHELRTPLTSIKGFVETLIDHAKENPEERERFLGIISNHVNRLNTIIEDLMTLSRLEKEAEQEAELEETQIDALLKDAVEVCDAKAGQRNIVLEIEGERGLAVIANASLLEQAVINLIDNAIKYSGEGATVRIGAVFEENRVHVHVSDDGPGIANEHIPRLFERFYRIDKARSRKLGGTGLGLSIVKHIMAVHKGTVTVRSTPQKGSIFSLHIPAATTS